ncbi:Hypothetical protein NTJ_07736 [Nesidiocoris tenuis]|uniref:Uncharacterized protein n=1 Tax=Nesidiocoris tenuis TaxID=355587 RepID=A0ABN7AWS9_9HEMI|nr:Hypothetical protein NTJ_07736 [Nesidiocoris tenuis]
MILLQELPIGGAARVAAARGSNCGTEAAGEAVGRSAPDCNVLLSTAESFNSAPRLLLRPSPPRARADCSPPPPGGHKPTTRGGCDYYHIRRGGATPSIPPMTTMSSGGEMAGVELVCRLMAATPPYLYNPNGPPHCYFFSDLLRSLVAKRCAASPTSEEQGTSKRLRIASIGSAFSARMGGGVIEAGNHPEHSSNPLSPSHFLPRLDILYRKLHATRAESGGTRKAPADESAPAEVLTTQDTPSVFRIADTIVKHRTEGPEL